MQIVETLGRVDERLKSHADSMEEFKEFEELRHKAMDRDVSRIWWVLISANGALVALLVAIVSYLLVNGPPWAA